MEKVFITGRGLITPLGNGLVANEAALRSGKSGIVFSPDYQENTGKNFYCNRCGCYFSATPDTYEQGQGT